jgi:hypothetical protein
MKTDIEKEIGELIQEITAKGFGGIEIDLLPGDEFDNAGFACVTVDNGKDESRFTVEADSLIVALGLVADSIRHQRGEPSREEELAKMLEDDDSHAAAPPVEVGPNASCTCGSRRRLKIERKIQVSASWETGQIISFFVSNPPQPGEIGTCPDCGRHWTFRA